MKLPVLDGCENDQRSEFLAEICRRKQRLFDVRNNVILTLFGGCFDHWVQHISSNKLYFDPLNIFKNSKYRWFAIRINEYPENFGAVTAILTEYS